MPDYKQLFGYSAIIASLGFLVHSLAPAHAVNGPTVSLGSNPIKNFYNMPTLSANATHTIFQNTSSQDFVVTKYLPPDSSAQHCNLTVDGQSVFYYSIDNGEHVSNHNDPGDLNLLISAGSTLEMKNYNPSYAYNCAYYIEGHYVHGS